MAIAYAFDNMLNAVGEVGSTSDFSAVTDLPRVMGAAGVLICKDKRGRFGGEEGCEFRDIMIVDVHVPTGASIIRSQDPEIWQLLFA
jgi:hypothetical protein